MKRQLLPQRSTTSLTTVDYKPLRKTAAILIRSAVPAYNSLSRLSLLTADIASTEGRGEEAPWILTWDPSHSSQSFVFNFEQTVHALSAKVHGLEETSWSWAPSCQYGEAIMHAGWVKAFLATALGPLTPLVTTPHPCSLRKPNQFIGRITLCCWDVIE